MIRNWLEELFDTLFYLGIMFGLIFFFVLYWRNSFQVRYAETVLDEFLDEVAADGKLSMEQYEGVVHRLLRINSTYDLEVACTTYVLQPCYAQLPKEQLDSYYMRRNVRKEKIFSEYKQQIWEEDAGKMCLQTETNTSILASAQDAYLPLPEEEQEVKVEAVRPCQEVYEGESLITLCKVTSKDGSYYVEASEICADISGKMQLEAIVEGRKHYVPIEVVCHPRTVTCLNGHEVVNSKEILEEWKQTGIIICPYCKAIPDSVQCNTSILKRRTGTALTRDELWVTVTYLDGHKEEIGPEAVEWEDNYDEYYCGIQEVTIRYCGAKTSVIIISENDSCKQCAGACNERYYTDYQAFPYCTSCMGKVLLFSGEVYEEEQELTNDEMITLLEEKKEVCLAFGDYITVRLTKDGEYQTVLQERINRDGKNR